MTPVFYCVEDRLSRLIMERLLSEYCGEGFLFQELLRRGSGGVGKMRVKSNFEKFFQIANRDPVIILIDLDDSKCPPSLKEYWIRSVWKREIPEKMAFCIAEVEAESWILADRKNLSEFIWVQEREISSDVQKHTKEYLLDLIKKSKNKNVKQMTAEKEYRIRKNAKDATGFSYINEFSKFIQRKWDPEEASKNSPSLKYLIEKLKEIKVSSQSPNTMPQ